MGKLIVSSSDVITDKSRGVWKEAVKFHMECHTEQDIWVGYINVRYTCLVEVF